MVVWTPVLLMDWSDGAGQEQAQLSGTNGLHDHTAIEI
jgi:hypothetical protein